MPERKIANRDALDQEHAHPSRARRAVLTGGALGLAAVAGSTLGGRAQPASAATQAFGPWTEITPSHDQSGVTDAMAINNAFAALPMVLDPDTNIKYSVGAVVLASSDSTSDFYVNSTIIKPPKADLIGSGPGTVIRVVGNITGISSHHGMTGGTMQHATKSGTIANLVVDGTQAGAGAIGIDVGDGWGHRIEHVWINNFTGSSAIGLSVVNRQFWTEKFQARDVTLVNNTTAVKHWTVVGAMSQEYQSVEYFIWAENNQNGLTFEGVLWNGHLVLNGNIGVTIPCTSPGCTTPPQWMVGLQPGNGNSSTVVAEGCINYEVNLMGGVNTDAGPNSVYFGDISSTFAFQGLFRDAGGGGMVHTGTTNAAPGQLQMRGIVIEGNNSLRAVTTPAVPVSGASVPNNQNDCMVYFSVSTGSITEVQVSGSTTGITGTFGQVFLPSQGPLPASGTQGTILIKYTDTGTLSWKWVSVI